ncbi:hypothetical protein BDR07DRAFT_1435130 [Suillus spraguei]|nr:hypothetical protein BDR07DRAFT_1435130 [Suillus spraguei]
MAWPAPFGRDLTKEEAYIQKLDASTSASLKLTVLNPLVVSGQCLRVEVHPSSTVMPL